MTPDMIAALIIAAFTMLLFIGGWFTVDLIAIMCMVVLCIFGLVTPEEAIAGFSNPATITVLAMFVMSEAVARTGALIVVGKSILNISGKSQSVALFLLMLFVGVSSMFINNTAAVALLIPVTFQVARSTGWCVSRLLMPLSFAAMAGGVCTLIGTSTNLLADSILVEAGYSGFKIFSFFKEGTLFFIATIVYSLIFYKVLIPPRREKINESESYELSNYLTYIRISHGSPYIGLDLESAQAETDFLIINRVESQAEYSQKIQEGDVLFVRADLNMLKELAETKSIDILPSLNFEDKKWPQTKRKIVEAVVSQDSKIVNRCVSEVDLFRRFGLKVMALRQLNRIRRSKLNEIILKAGDTLLLAVPENHIERLRASKMFVLMHEPDVQFSNKSLLIPTLLVLAAVILVATFNLLPIYISALAGICLLVVLKVMTFDEVYNSINWRIIFLLAGLLSLGKALENTGALKYISGSLVNALLGASSSAIIASFFMLTIVVTSLLSNNAAAIVMIPLALYSSEALGVNPIELAIVVMFAASLSFLTPIGYQTNMMVYGVGQYQFKDFLKFGGPLVIVMMLTAIVVFA